MYVSLPRDVEAKLDFTFSKGPLPNTPFIFISDDKDKCHEISTKYPLSKVVILDTQNDEELEYHFIRCLNVSEINSYINEPHVTLKRTYAIKGKRGVRYLNYHMYLRGWIFTKDYTRKIDYYIHIHDNSFKPVYNIKSYLSTNCDNITEFTNKHKLYDQVPEFMPKRYDLYNYDVKYPVILKPEGKIAFGGHGIMVVNDKNEYLKAKPVIEKARGLTYGAYEYITNPLLFNGYKFHLRVYMIVSSWRCSLFNIYRILHASEPYQNSDFSNTKIHDTHVKSTKDNYFFPRHMFSWKANQQILALFDKLKTLIKPKPYFESDLAYEVLAMDIMIREDESIALLEVNDKPGLNLVFKNKDYWYQAKFAEWELSFVKDVFDVSLHNLREINNEEIKQLHSITSREDLMKAVGYGKPWSLEDINKLKMNDQSDSTGHYLDRAYCQWFIKSGFEVVGYLGLRPFKERNNEPQIRIFTYPPGNGFGKLAIQELLRIYKGVIWSVVKFDNAASNALFKSWTFEEGLYVGAKHRFYKCDNRYMVATNIPVEERKPLKYYRLIHPNKGPDFVIHDGRQKIDLSVAPKAKHLIVSDNLSYENLPAIICSSLKKAILYINKLTPKLNKCQNYTLVGNNGMRKYYLHLKLRSWPMVENGCFVHREANAKHFSKCFLKNQIDGIEEFINKDYLYKHMKEFMPATYTVEDKLDFNDKVYLVKPVGPGAYSGESIHVAESQEDLKQAIFAITRKNKKWRISIQEYVINPLLYKGLKFHARVHMMVASWGCFLFPEHEILHAKLPYKNGDYKNKLIHDSHGASTPYDLYLSNVMPDLYEELHNRINQVFEAIRDRIKTRPYGESIFGYEMLGLDILFTKEKTYLLEINNKVGQTSNCNGKRPIWEKKYLDWEYECIKDFLP